MKPNIHPKYEAIEVVCSCGNKFTTRSTMNKKSLQLEVCASCHPFYTGQQRVVDTTGRIDRFNARFRRGGDSAAKTK